MDSLAVILPRHAPQFSDGRRDALLTAHAAQLARAVSSEVRVRIFAVGEAQPNDVLARLSAHRPAHVLIEHTPFAYDRQGALPLAAGAWARAHSAIVTVAAHPEFGRAYDPPDAATHAALVAAGPLFAQAARIFCHESAWARAIGIRIPSTVPRLELLDPWPFAEPAAPTPVDTDAPWLVLLDDVPKRALAPLFARVRSERRPCRWATLFAGDGERARVAHACAAAGVSMEEVPIGDGASLAAAIVAASLVVIAEPRVPLEAQRWTQTALAFGRRVAVVSADGAVTQIERPLESCWKTIAHAVLSRDERASAASFEEDVEEPSIGV